MMDIELLQMEPLSGLDSCAFGDSGYKNDATEVLSRTDIKRSMTIAAQLVQRYDPKYWPVPGQAKLANDIGSSDRSVRSYLKDLEASGELSLTY